MCPTALVDRPSLFDPAPAAAVDSPAIDQRAARRALEAKSAERSSIVTKQTAAVGGGITLEAAVSGVWEVLTAHRVAACVVCDGRMAPRYGASGLVLGGRCTDCGSTLA